MTKGKVNEWGEKFYDPHRRARSGDIQFIRGYMSAGGQYDNFAGDACDGNKFPLLKILIEEYGADPNESIGCSLLDTAVEHKNLKMVKYLLSKGAVVNERAIWYACEQKYFSILKELFKHTEHKLGNNEFRAMCSNINIFTGNHDVKPVNLKMIIWVLENERYIERVMEDHYLPEVKELLLTY